MAQIETERLVIRKFMANDWKDLHEYLSDPMVVQFEPYSIQSEEQCKKHALYRQDADEFLAVCLRSNGKMIGNLYAAEQSHLNWEIGYVFNQSYHSMGYATEAVEALLIYLYEIQKAHRVIAYCDPKNDPSWKLLERVGMRREGHFLQNVYFDVMDDGTPLWKDTYLYARLAE